MVGAGSVVTKDIEPYSVSAGVPAKKYVNDFPTRPVRHSNRHGGACQIPNEDLVFYRSDSFLREVKASGDKLFNFLGVEKVD